MKTLMMKKLLLVILLLTGSTLAHAQREEARQRIESAKIAYITEHVSLTPEQAEKFWPIYNELNQKRRENYIEFAQKRKAYDPETATEEETQTLLQMGMQVKEKQFEIEKEYNKRLQAVLDLKQMLALQDAERDFKKMLFERLEKRRNSHGGKTPKDSK
ncbi:hypothetical protein N7E81_14310 [Reichenbachiella carrageenanivorans]|uniref:Sensor of ECF-type sigma factor n=1 Tax=Reichenbachiella carrageenanivorans TaxID=2979869 RepID=A0ABY6CX88_9BACT|nr:hypothetical protein [Reichenbachiella carrageenanivorans]UXX78531.1 hypothetical protein N7E81_14310 [Reichenbachiella carrageenanivorans]